MSILRAVSPNSGLRAAPSRCLSLYQVAVCITRYKAGMASVHRGSNLPREMIIIIQKAASIAMAVKPFKK